VTGMLSTAGEKLGFDLRDDLLELLDGEIAFVTVATDAENAFPGTSMDPVNFGALIGLKDGAAFAAFVDDAIEGTGLHNARVREEVDGQIIDHFRLIPTIALHYAILDDVLLASPSDALVHEMLARHEHPELPTLAKLPSFVASLGQMPASRGLLSYSDTAAQVEGAFRSLKFLPEILAGARRDIDEVDPGHLDWITHLDWLLDLPMPDPAVARRYLGQPTLTTIAVDERGVHIRSIGP